MVTGSKETSRFLVIRQVISPGHMEAAVHIRTLTYHIVNTGSRAAPATSRPGTVFPLREVYLGSQGTSSASCTVGMVKYLQH